MDGFILKDETTTAAIAKDTIRTLVPFIVTTLDVASSQQMNF